MTDLIVLIVSSVLFGIVIGCVIVPLIYTKYYFIFSKRNISKDLQKMIDDGEAGMALVITYNKPDKPALKLVKDEETKGE